MIESLGAQLCRQCFGDREQHPIARGVATRIVDVLEIVDVDECQ
jgi:hypothetical protein